MLNEENMFISAEKAIQIAQLEIKNFLTEEEPMFVLWKNASTGQAVLVSDVLKQPSYWLIPIVLQERVIGFVRIMGSGSVNSIGTFCRNFEEINSCPTVVTGITKQAAQHLVEEKYQLKKDETFTEPIFVYDGSIGREVWLIEIVQNEKVIRYIFAGSGGIYERSTENAQNRIPNSEEE